MDSSDQAVKPSIEGHVLIRKRKGVQSGGLSQRLTKLYADGLHLNDDSADSESMLNRAMVDIIEYAKSQFAKLGYEIKHKKTITLYECQKYFHICGGPEPDEKNRGVSMKPDGGILVAVKDKQEIPVLIVEDKVQGTNDTLFANGKKRQATGNAIERGAKNIRGAEMIFAGLNVFPYVIFASGCDFHSSETISKRLEMMNMGIPNYSIELSPTITVDEVHEKITSITDRISIKKICGKGIASIFVKSHKWDEMPHRSSLWKKDEIVVLCKKVLDNVIEAQFTS